MIDNSLFSKVREGQTRFVARLITLIERNSTDAEEAVRALYAGTGHAYILGITGSPGSGKSSLVNELAKAFRRRPLPNGNYPRVGIIAVDPSSPFTGGALLGDRVRMRDLSGDEGIFIRSMASRGKLGGLAETTGAVAKVLDAAGFDIILIETVGAGQAEVDIAGTAHTVLVIEAPGMGDEIQSIKAGILEIADILIVNKADHPNTSSTVKALQLMLHLNPVGSRLIHHGKIMEIAGTPTSAPTQGWEIPLHQTIATEGKGIPELIEAIYQHHNYLQTSGEWHRREYNRSRQEISQLLQDRFMSHLRVVVPENQREQLITAVANRYLDPYSAVAQLYDKVRQQ